jgi:phosphopantetheine--protein transferase-like protein
MMLNLVNVQELASFTADYWQLDRAAINDALTFGVAAIPRFTSLRFFRFLAALEDKFGMRVSDPGSVTSYAALKAVLVGAAAEVRNGHHVEAPQPVSPPVPIAGPQPTGVSAIGHDIEENANLPEASDYRSDPFYRTHFTSAEIDYCTQSTNPRQHFAARFCAKEAVRKCGPMYAALQPRDIEVINTESGQPEVRITNADVSDKRLMLSMAHSNLFASAFVVILG